MRARYIVMQCIGAKITAHVWQKGYQNGYRWYREVDTSSALTLEQAAAICDQLNQKLADRLRLLQKVKVNQRLRVKDSAGREQIFVILRKDKVRGNVIPQLYGWQNTHFKGLEDIEMYTEMEIIQEALP